MVLDASPWGLGGISLIGKGIALEYAFAVFVPRLADHIPGATNVIIDQLSSLS